MHASAVTLVPARATFDTVAFDATVMYVGPRFRYARSRLTLWHAPAATVDNATQHDVPTPWSRVDVTDASVYTDYSALTNGLMRDPATPDRSHVGVLWGGCVLPFPFRVWCARYWQVAYTRVAWPPRPGVATWLGRAASSCALANPHATLPIASPSPGGALLGTLRA